MKATFCYYAMHNSNNNFKSHRVNAADLQFIEKRKYKRTTPSIHYMAMWNGLCDE